MEAYDMLIIITIIIIIAIIIAIITITIIIMSLCYYRNVITFEVNHHGWESTAHVDVMWDLSVNISLSLY